MSDKRRWAVFSSEDGLHKPIAKVEEANEAAIRLLLQRFVCNALTLLDIQNATIGGDETEILAVRSGQMRDGRQYLECGVDPFFQAQWDDPDENH